MGLGARERRGDGSRLRGRGRGGGGAGDPANDLVPAWSCLRGDDRLRFRTRLAPDDGTWARARGIALAQAVVAIPYYDRTNPAFAALCRATLAELLVDPA